MAYGLGTVEFYFHSVYTSIIGTGGLQRSQCDDLAFSMY